MRRIYSIPKLIKRTKEYCIVSFNPHYDETHLIINRNDFGITPIDFKPKVIRYTPLFSLEDYIISDYKRKKWEKLSGKRAYIYALICNERNTPIYIGSTVNYKTRMLQHIRKTKSANKSNPINKIEPIKMILLCDCPQEFQFDEEARWIKGASRNYKLRNITNNERK